MSNPASVKTPSDSLILNPRTTSALILNTRKDLESQVEMVTVIIGYQVEKIRDFLEAELAKKQVELAKFNKQFDPENSIRRAHTIGEFDGQIKLLLDLIAKLSVLE